MRKFERFKKAQRFQIRHLKICQNIYEENDVNVAESFMNLGSLYKTMKLFAKSEENYLKSLNIYDKLRRESILLRLHCSKDFNFSIKK